MCRGASITYLMAVPDNVCPFSLGLKANLREFFTGRLVERPYYVLPSDLELEVKSKTETLWDNKYYSCC
jgi:hypothetical protein